MKARALLCLAACAATACGDADVVTPAARGYGKAPAAGPPEHVVGGFGVDLPAITLAPGEERTPCYLAPLDIDGPSRIVGGGYLEVTKGMHHGNITTRKKSGEGFRKCPKDVGSGVDGEGGDILDGGAVLFGSSTQIEGREWQSFPPGDGFRVKDGYEIVARMHYLNVTSEPLVIAPRYRWFTIDEGTMVHELGPFAWAYLGFEIPPRSELTVSADCSLPAPMQIVNLLPHMHRLGKAFTAGFVGGALDGTLFLNSVGYDPDRGVLTQYDPPVDLSQGDGARFSCTWNNTLDKTIVEGIGDNEMCILFGYAWPPENAYSAVGAGEGSCLVVAPPAP